MFERIAPERHDTLPEVPEPAENPLLVGHEDTASRLAQAYRTGKLHHALMFAGPPGIGKATFAFHLASHLFTHPDPQNAPENLAPIDREGRVFKLIAQDAHPSLLHLRRPYVERDKKFKTVITVEEIRRVHRFLSLTPHDGGYRVVIVDPADDMNTSAANALLKVLEEPPPRTLFVLIAHWPGRLLPTIRSRCQVTRFSPLSPPQLSKVLQNLSIEGEGADGTNRAHGSVRDAILLAQFGGLDISQALERLLNAPTFDIAEAQRLGDALVGRDRQVQFALFNDAVRELIARRAQEAAASGDSALAARAAELWQEVSQSVREAEIYNLDRKQHALGLTSRLHAAFSE